MSLIDTLEGYRHADDELAPRSANPLEVLVAGMPNWRPHVARRLIESSAKRKAAGINPDYQDGVIRRALEALGQ